MSRFVGWGGVVALLGACLAACGANGGARELPDPGPDAGIDSSAVLSGLTPGQNKQLCDWVAGRLGGYQHRVSCSDGDYLIAGTCPANLPDYTCSLTVGDVETCVNYMVGGCAAFSPDCVALVFDCLTVPTTTGGHGGGGAGGGAFSGSGGAGGAGGIPLGTGGAAGAGGAGGAAGTGGGSMGTGGAPDCTGQNGGAAIIATCAQQYCHDANGAQACGGLDLTIDSGLASRLVGVVSSGGPASNGSVCAGAVTEPYLIANSNPATGLLIDKCTAVPPCGARMPYYPLNGKYLSSTQQACLVQWATTLTSP